VSRFSLAGRTALVTGASRGIGAAIARALDEQGATVVVCGRDYQALAEVAVGLERPTEPLVADLSDEMAVSALAASALDRGPIDILVNNAGVGVRMDSTDLDGSIIDAIHVVNVRALLLLTTALLPAMVERSRGSIINISSISGVRGTPRRAAYAASKGAVDAMTRSLAMEFGPSGVRVNAVAPGAIVTDMWERNRAVPGVIEAVESQTALRRWGTPHDIADVVAFLASDAARYVTGQTIEVDGGMASTLDLYGGAV